MSVMRISVLILATFAFLLAGCVASKSRVPLADIGRKMVILGRLGRPIGEEVTIHGHKEPPRPMTGADCFRVDTVNGERLENPTVVNVRGTDKWPSNAEATIRGYEAGDIRFEHIDDLNYGPDDPRFKTHQVIWMNFEGVEVVKPANLKLEYLGDVGRF
jgi:hypothetical protein